MAEGSSEAKLLPSIRRANSPRELANHRRELENMRHRDKIDWALNREFYKNNQWTWWNKAWPNGGRLENEPIDEGDKPHYKVRLTDNQILPGVNHYVAQLTKSRPMVYATPNTGSDSDLKASQVATALYDFWWHEFGLGSKVQSALTHAALSQGYWFIGWDKFAAKELNYMVTPQGQPMVGPQWPEESLELYRQQLQQEAEAAGANPQEIVQQMSRTMYLGDVSIKVLPGENVLLDPTQNHFEDAGYAVIIEPMDPEDVRARYKKAPNDLQPDAVASDDSISLNIYVAGATQFDSRRQKTVRRVYHLYVRPSAILPKGRHVVWIEGPDQILLDEPWPFPFKELPLVKFPGLERPDSPLDIPVTTAARPLQKDINRTISQIVEHKNLTLKSQLLAPTGSIQGKWTNEPGRTVYFNPINGIVPSWRQIPDLPGYVFNHLEQLQARVDRLYNRLPSQRDQLPARIDSGVSIDAIQETVADQLAITIQRLEEALVRAGTLMVELAHHYYIEPRMLKIVGQNGSVQVQRFLNEDLDGGFGFRAEAGSAMPRTRAGKQARIEFMLTNQLIDARTAMRYLDTADLYGVNAKMKAGEEEAYRTLEKLKQGQPLNIVALQQAQQQVQQAMMDPNADLDGDGIPDTPQQKQAAAQQMLEQAALSAMPHEDPETHLDVLSLFMNSVEFETLDPQIQSLFVQRYYAMIDRWVQITQATQMMQAPVQKPRTAVQIKTTASPQVLGEILRDQGVQLQDEQVAMPPLDTWVTDDLTKPEVQNSGNTHMDQAQQVQALQQTDEAHALKQAKAAHEVAQAAEGAQQAQQQTQQGQQQQAAASNDQARQEELHRMKMMQEAAKLQALHHRAKHAAKPPAKAKPSGG